MSVKSIFPLSYFSDLFIAALVFLVAVRSRRIVDIVPVLWCVRLLLILLTFLSASPLTLLAAVESIDVVIVSVGRPVCKRCLYRWLCGAIMLDRSSLGSCSGNSGGSLWNVAFRFRFLRSYLRSFGRLETECSCIEQRRAETTVSQPDPQSDDMLTEGQIGIYRHLFAAFEQKLHLAVLRSGVA